MSFHAVEGYWTAARTSLRRYTLRLDGFVSVNAPMSGGELITKPIVFAGKMLSLNISTSVARSLRVQLLSPDGKPLAAFTLEDCDELFGDTLDRTVTCKGNANVSPPAGKPLRTRFALRDAALFASQFRNE